jgi:hypothetical protein
MFAEESRLRERGKGVYTYHNSPLMIAPVMVQSIMQMKEYV